MDIEKYMQNVRPMIWEYGLQQLKVLDEGSQVSPRISPKGTNIYATFRTFFSISLYRFALIYRLCLGSKSLASLSSTLFRAFHYCDKPLSVT